MRIYRNDKRRSHPCNAEAIGKEQNMMSEGKLQNARSSIFSSKILVRTFSCPADRWRIENGKWRMKDYSSQ
jgi:hypothetical protein